MLNRRELLTGLLLTPLAVAIRPQQSEQMPTMPRSSIAGWNGGIPFQVGDIVRSMDGTHKAVIVSG